MARRDLTNFNTVTQIQPERPDQTVEVIQDIGNTIIRQSQEAKINENLSNAQLEINALNTQYQIDYEGDPFGGLDKLKEERKKVLDRYSKDVSPFFMRQWNRGADRLSQSDNIQLQSWGIKQARTNTVNSFNRSLKNNFLQANLDGQSGRPLGDILLNMDVSRQQMLEFGTKNLGSETTAEVLEDYDKDYLKSVLSGIASKNPQQAANLLNEPIFKDKFSSDEVGEFGRVIKKSSRQHRVKSAIDTDAVEGGVLDFLNDENVSFQDKRLQIDELDFSGKISSKMATKARRLLTSEEAVDSVTNADVMADFITKAHDLNAIQETNSEDYLIGVQNLRAEITDAQADGKLNSRDAAKLNNQLKTLTSAKLSGATEAVAMDIGKATDHFKMLPPQYRGEATRKLFYQVHDKELSNDQKEQLARKIVDETNKSIRGEVVKKVEALQKPDDQILKEKGYTAQDVKDTAKKYGITEAEVIQKLKAK